MFYDPDVIKLETINRNFFLDFLQRGIVIYHWLSLMVKISKANFLS